MKKTKQIALIALLFTLSSCTERGCQSMRRSFQYSERDYEVIMFSGGDTVFVDRFHGIINGEEGTDGVFYIKNDTLIEVSGDYVIKSVK